MITDSGRPISAQDAILRNLLRIVDYLPSLYAIGIISCLISPQNKRVGDYLAGTVVVHEKPLEDARSLWDRPATPLLATTQSRTLSSRRASACRIVPGPPAQLSGRCSPLDGASDCRALP